ncbi:Transmembrane protein TauE like [Carpediemonas membranifera]|uniref:Transmembrane protein TauE like n=1 Tax=Carpediemonas membranifera TaxID=201153 RepID=A0A8J6E5D4_9EUKA|nr:Transmembrane protein TauE like [Carpediemonas membranifera]|eukprot:KAG9395602.1 Transmembrane protein TauE like [Carpediemonas membranifera]
MLLEDQLSFLNDADPILSLWLFVTGFFVGCVAALFGVGGGIITVPAMTILFGVDGLAATNISTGAIVFTSTNSFFKMVRQRRVSFAAGIPFVIFAVPGSIIGSLIATFIPRASILQATFAIFMLSLASIKLTSIGMHTVTKLLRVIRKRRGIKAYPVVDASTDVTVSIASASASPAPSDTEDAEALAIDELPDDTAGSNTSGEADPSEQTSSEEHPEAEDAHHEDRDDTTTAPVHDDHTASATDDADAIVLHVDTFVQTIGPAKTSLLAGLQGGVPRLVLEAYYAGLKATLRRPWRVQSVRLPGLSEPMAVWPTLPLCSVGAAIGAFLGLSGGVIFVPLLTMLAKLPGAKAIPVSTMAIWFSIWFAAATRLLLASMDFYYVVPIGVGSIFGSTFVLNSFGKLNSDALLAGFWLLCIASALRMGWSAVQDLLL